MDWMEMDAHVVFQCRLQGKFLRGCAKILIVRKTPEFQNGSTKNLISPR